MVQVQPAGQHPTISEGREQAETISDQRPIFMAWTFEHDTIKSENCWHVKSPHRTPYLSAYITRTPWHRDKHPIFASQLNWMLGRDPPIDRHTFSHLSDWSNTCKPRCLARLAKVLANQQVASMLADNKFVGLLRSRSHENLAGNHSEKIASQLDLTYTTNHFV